MGKLQGKEHELEQKRECEKKQRQEQEKKQGQEKEIQRVVVTVVGQDKIGIIAGASTFTEREGTGHWRTNQCPA